MKEYSLRQGVVLVELCGEHLLVSTKESRNRVPYVTQINDTAAQYWRILSKKHTLPELLELSARESDADHKTLLLGWMKFIKTMSDRGYLITEDTNDQP